MSDRVPLAGLLGRPAGHSLSPKLHGHWLSRYGIRGHYVPLDVSQNDLRRVVETMPVMGFVGANVTIPHKEAILGIADSVSDRAALIGAANTLIFREGGSVYADNTDGIGFLASLRSAAPDWSPKSGPAAIFGAGGAARAVLTALLDAGAPEVRITNRTKSRAETLRREFGSRVITYEWVQAGNILEDATTVVNASSLGMSGKAAFRVPMDALMPGAVVCDLVYTPLRTEFLAQAEAYGGIPVDGLGMLIHQAVPGFERWFGVKPEADEMARAILLNG